MTDRLPSPLGLEDVLVFARSHRAEIAAARARARAAAERPGIVSALDDPIVTPSLDHLPFRFHGADVSLTIEQRFPLSGELGNRRRVAEAELRRVRAEAVGARLDVELEATTAFLMLHEQRRMRTIVGEQLALARQLVTAASARYAAAAGAQSDLLRAEIEVARLEGATRWLGSEIRAAEAMLNASIGREADAQIPRLASPAQTQLPPEWSAVRGTALKNRPELAAGRAEVRRNAAEIAVMQSMYGPMAMVRFGPAYTMSDGPGWMTMVGISIPVWQGKLGSGVREAQAMTTMARADLKAMTRMVEGEAATARHRVLAARARFLSLREDVVPRTRRAVDPALAAYAAVQVPLVSVLEAAQTLWSAEAELVSAEVELGLAWARLRRATNGNRSRK